MGIVNITPDSFSDGGDYFDASHAAIHMAKLIQEGADILDLGAESTRPGYHPINAEEEWDRLAPVLQSFDNKKFPFISIDTTKSKIAEQSLKYGVSMINDVSGFRDDAMPHIIAEYGATCIAMHNHNSDKNKPLWDDFRFIFDDIFEKAEHAQLPKEAIILDPGIGFGKTIEQNIEAIKLIEPLKKYYQCPVLVGASRKSMIDKILHRDVSQRLSATLGIHLSAAHYGAKIFRIHDVIAHYDALTMWTLMER